MKRLIYTLLVAAFAAVPLPGRAKAYKSVMVTCHDGTSLYIKGEKDLTMSVEDEELRFYTTGENHIAFPAENVKSFLLSSHEGDVDVAAVEEVGPDRISFERRGESLIFGNLPAGSRVMVSNMAGILLFNAEAEGSLTVDASSFTPGIYIVAINNKTFKIAVAK